MNTLAHRIRRHAVSAALLLGSASAVWAFPPAPCHTLYGMVRDEMGDPIMASDAVVTLETTAGIHVQTVITPNMAPGMNYRLRVPMDAGLTSDSYRTNALKPTVPFTLKVTIGNATYLPLELHGSYKNLGKPAQSTQLDLTLGADSDGDGLPDAWERMVLDMLGMGSDIAVLKPGDDADGDGLTNLQEYLAGTYAFDPEDGIRLDIVGFNRGHPLLDFLTIKGRSYTVQASQNLTAWTPVTFSLPAEATGNALLARHAASDTRVVRAEANTPTNGLNRVWFYKLIVQ